MARIFARRLVEMALSMVAATLVVFILARISGDPTQLLVPIDATPEEIEAKRHELGLDRPLYEQYADFLTDALRGDLGTSIRLNRPVSEIVLQRLPTSLTLAGLAIAIAMVVGVPLGVLAATHEGTGWDAFARGIAFVGQAAPPFAVGITLILLLGVTFPIFPVSGGGGLEHYVLPAITLGWFIAAGVVRLVRSSLLEVLSAGHIVFLRAEGIGELSVVWLHALRSGIPPTITYISFMFGIIIGSAVVIETVFTLPGLGRTAYSAVLNRDYPMLQGVVLAWVAIVLIVQLLSDVLQSWIDPRIRGLL